MKSMKIRNLCLAPQSLGKEMVTASPLIIRWMVYIPSWQQLLSLTHIRVYCCEETALLFNFLHHFSFMPFNS
jgi:hypothetical protein